MDSLIYNAGLVLNTAGAWVAFVFTLMIFSALVGDNLLSRLAQHILIGAGVGYAGVLAIRHLLVPQLILPIQDGSADLASVWMPMALVVVLLFAGLDRILLQGRTSTGRLALWHRVVQSSGRLVVALLLGVGLGAGIMGAIQGTLIPQYMRAAEMGVTDAGSSNGPLIGILTLLITAATIMQLFISPQRHLRDQPGYARGFMMGWLWIGQRAIWFASGLIFARLISSRMTLLIARVQFLAQFIDQLR